jgi:hypothetical protein
MTCVTAHPEKEGHLMNFQKRFVCVPPPHQSDGSIHRHVGKPAWIEARAHPDADA